MLRDHLDVIAHLTHVASLGNARLPSVLTLDDPSTETLTVYELYEADQAYAPVPVDTSAVTNGINNEFAVQNVDAVVVSTKTVTTNAGMWVQVKHYVATQTVSASGQVTALEVGALSLCFIAILTILLTMVMSYAYSMVMAYFKQEQDMSYPKVHYVKNPSTGKVEGPFSEEQAYTLKQAYYPGKWIEPVTDSILDPNDPNFEEHKKFILETTPPDWGEPEAYGGWITMIVIGAIAVAGIYLVAKVVPAFIHKKGE